jgi:hypothetical protein
MSGVNPDKSSVEKVGAPNSLVHFAGYIIRDKRVPARTAGTGFGSVGRKCEREVDFGTQLEQLVLSTILKNN